jgi:GntR family transcriptional repressor for pyruvate dehydrogenase complex
MASNVDRADLALAPVDLGERGTVSTEVTRRLLDYVLAGAVKPGERLPPERKLAEALGVGRTVVREALKSLTILGLVEVRQGDGNYLRGTESAFLPRVIEWGLLLGAKRTRDLVEARRVIEVSVAGLAAERRSDAALAAIRDRLADMEGAETADDLIAADIAFHLSIAEAAGNETLLQIMTSMWSLLQVWISRVIHAATDFSPTIEEHRKVLDALEAGSSRGASKAMQEHLLSALKRLEATLPQEDHTPVPDGARERRIG